MEQKISFQTFLLIYYNIYNVCFLISILPILTVAMLNEKFIVNPGALTPSKIKLHGVSPHGKVACSKRVDLGRFQTRFSRDKRSTPVSRTRNSCYPIHIFIYSAKRYETRGYYFARG